MGVDNAFAASLWLLQSLFPAVALGPLAPWLRAMTGRDAVRARALRYGQMLGWPGTQRLSPLNDARLALEGKWTTHQRAAVRARLLMRAPIAHMARRIAAAARPADRALV